MSVSEPKFVNDPHFHMGENGWYLDEDTPEDVKKEFEEYMEYEAECEKRGISL